MFDLHDFVMKTLRSMKNTEPEYKVRKLALVWLEKDVLTLEDMAEIDSWYPAIDPGEDEGPEEESAVVEP